MKYGQKNEKDMKSSVYTVGLTGGIGSGKTTLAKMLEEKGAAVYYADTRAKEMMDADHVLVENIKDLLGPQAYRHGRLDRAYVAERVFLDKSLLGKLNALVHPAVYMDFEHWRLCLSEPYAVLESAILFESGGDSRCDVTVAVTIPEDLRVKRVMERDGTDESAVMARMRSQMSDTERSKRADIVVDEPELDGKRAAAARLDAFFREQAARQAE